METAYELQKICFQTIWTGEEYGFDQAFTEDEDEESSGDGNDRAHESMQSYCQTATA